MFTRFPALFPSRPRLAPCSSRPPEVTNPISAPLRHDRSVPSLPVGQTGWAAWYFDIGSTSQLTTPGRLARLAAVTQPAQLGKLPGKCCFGAFLGSHYPPLARGVAHCQDNWKLPNVCRGWARAALQGMGVMGHIARYFLLPPNTPWEHSTASHSTAILPCPRQQYPLQSI